MSNRRMTALTSALLAAFALLAAADAPALARKRAVVLGFSGPGGSRARRGVVGALRRRARLLPPRAYARAARRLRVQATNPNGIPQVCARVRCHAVVSGGVKRQRGRYVLTVVLYDGSSGQVLGQREERVRSRRQLARAGARVGRALGPLVRQAGRGRGQPLPPQIAGDVPPPRAAPPRRDAVGGDQADDQVKPPEWAEEQAHERTDEQVEGKAQVGPQLETFTASLGLGFAMRSYELATADETSTYDGGAYPELTLDAVVYPATRLTSTFARHLGLGISYSRHVSISTDDTSTTGGTSGADTSVDTSSQQLLLDARARWIVLEGSWSPVVTGFFGWGFRDFDLSENDVLTSFNYNFLRLGLDGLVPLLTPYASLELGFDVRPLLGVGQDAVNAYGKRDGGLAWAVRVGGVGSLPFGLVYFARFEYLSFSTDFAGRTDLELDQIRPVDRTVASSGSDTFVRFWVGAGYTL